MARNKPLGRKMRLARALKSNRAIPIWVVIRTSRRIRWNMVRRHWRRSKLKV
ncbi:MAG: 50S ribosomal protein L39e [Aeropyrum sp.]|nr:50S ribosomal protein L39e [Aeropyrum sp.]MCE4616053.1 50S ribosomal protein L39e [Aeropyrum sp.]